MKKFEQIELDLKDVDALLERTKAVLPPEDYEIIKAMAETIYLLSQSVDKKAASIRRLLRMLFGAATEKLEKAEEEKKSGSSGNTSGNKPKKGHGRNGASDYTGAEKVEVDHDTLKPGDNCPECLKGKVYEIKEPKKVVRITGNAPRAHHGKRPFKRYALRDAAAAVQPVRRDLHCRYARRRRRAKVRRPLGRSHCGFKIRHGHAV